MPGTKRHSHLGEGSVVALVVMCVACSSTPDQPATSSVAGAGQGGAVGGMGGALAGGQSGAAGATSGSGGVAGSAGTVAAGTGGGGGGSGGTGGSGGGLLPGCEALGTPGNTGVQCDPGTEGNGTFDQMQPDGEQPPEADGEPAGEFTGTASFESTTYGYSFDYR